MPLRAPTPEEIEYFRQQGVDVDNLPSELNFSDEPKNTIPSTIAKTLKAHAGSIAGGGAGALGTGALLASLGLAPFTEGVSLVPSLLALTGIAGGAAAGSYAGGKAQEAVLPSEYNKRLQQEASEAAEENPKTAAATDIAASALASGGFPSARIPALAAKGVGKALVGKGMQEAEKAALKNIAVQSAINPAINAGMEYAQSGQLPSIKSLAAQALGGAAFAGHNPILSRPGYIDVDATSEPATEPNQRSNPANPNPPIPEDQGLTGTSDSTASPKPSEPARLDITRDIPKVVVDSKPDPEKLVITELRPQQAPTEIPVQNIPTTIKPNFEVSPRETVPVKQPVSEIPIPYAKPQPKEEVPIKTAETEKPTVPVEAPKSEEVAPTKPVEAAPQAATSQEDLIAKLKAQGEADLKAKIAEQGGKIRESSKKKFESGFYVEDLKTGNIIGPFGSREGALNRFEMADIGDRNDFTEQYNPKGHFYNSEEANESFGSSKIIHPDDYLKINYPEINEENIKKGLYTKKDIGQRESSGPTEPIPIPIKQVSKIPVEGKTVAEVLKMAMEHPEHSKDPFFNILNEMNIDPVALHKVQITSTPRGEIAAFEQGKNIIKMPRDANSADFAHEVSHAAIAYKLPAEFDAKGAEAAKAYNDYLKNGKDENIKELIRAYYETVRQLGIHQELFGEPEPAKASGLRQPIRGMANQPEVARNADTEHAYAMQNLHEFLAGVWDDEPFRNKLNEMPSGLNDNKSMWSRLIELFRKFLGLDVKQGNMLERVLRIHEKLAAPEQERLLNKNLAERGANPKKKDELSFLEGPFRSTIDRISDIDHPLASKLSDAAYKMLNTKDQLRGKFLNPVLVKGEHISAAQDKHLDDAMWADIMGKPIPYFRSKAEQDTWNAAKKSMSDSQDWRIANREPVDVGGKAMLPTKKDNFWYVSPNTDVINTLKKGGDDPKIDNYKKEFIDNEVNNFRQSTADAEEHWKAFRDSIQGNVYTSERSGSLEHYGQNRKADMIPLPRSMAKQGFLKNFEAGLQRAVTDMAFFKEIESNPNAMSALGQKIDPWKNPIPKSPSGSLANNPSVHAFLKNVQGDLAGAGFHNEKALSNLATATMLGPLTEVHKVIASHIGPLDYISNPYQLSRFLGAAIKNRSSAYENAVENGVIKMRASKLSDFLTSDMTVADKWRTLAQTVRKVYTLNDLTTKLAITSMQAGWEGVLPTKIERANAGNKYEQSLLKKIDPDYTVGKTYSPDEIPKLASNMVNRIQGTGDSRTMPDWMSGDSELSGFFKLSHWSLAQTNRFYQDLVEPAKNGNIAPLMRGIFGAAIGGYMIKELREKLGAKKGQIPSLEEIAASSKGFSGNIPAIAYNMMAASTYAGLGGVLAMLGKAPLDAIFKNRPQGMIFPLDEAASDLAETIGKVTTAIANDPQLNWVELAQAIGGHLLSSNFQLGRVVYNQAIDNGVITGTQAEKKALSDKLGQLRRFQMVEHLPYNEQDIGGQSYMNLEQKKFKMEPDIGKAVQQIPEMVQHIMEKYGDQPDVMMSKLKALKENPSSATFPSLEDTPIQFVKYMEYLTKLKGEEGANAELMSYLMKKMVNQAKSSVVP